MCKLFGKKGNELKIEDTEDLAVLMMSSCVKSVVAVCNGRPENVEYPDSAAVTFLYDGMEFELNITLNPITPNEEE